MTRNQNHFFESRSVSSKGLLRKYPGSNGTKLYLTLLIVPCMMSLQSHQTSLVPKETKLRPYLGGLPALINHLWWQSWVQGWLISWEKEFSQHSNLGPSTNALIQLSKTKAIIGRFANCGQELLWGSLPGGTSKDKITRVQNKTLEAC